MKATYTAFGGRITVEIEGSTIKDLFEAIGPLAEVLDADQQCGACKSQSIYPRAREAQGFTFYELCCAACGARLSFGQHKEGGTLWAKRSDREGHDLPNLGWAKYERPAERGMPTSAQAPGSTPDPPGLKEYLRRVRFRDSEQDVIVELCDLIIAAFGTEEADKFWKLIIEDKPNNEVLVRRLYAKGTGTKVAGVA